MTGVGTAIISTFSPYPYKEAELMSILTEALDRIMIWMQQHTPEYAVSFLPGLSLDQIMVSTEGFSFLLPNELYELYQWRNGTLRETNSLFFPSFQFLPLSEATKICQEICNDSVVGKLFTFENQLLFPFMAEEGRHCAVQVCYATSMMTSPVVYLGKQGASSCIDYESLTSMMLTFAECYESEAFYMDDDGYVDENKCRVAEILCKYNPKIVGKALVDVQILLTDFEYNFETSNLITNSLRTLKRFKPPGAYEILNEALERYSSDAKRQNITIRSLINKALLEIECTI
jgi:hypothetical protein